MAAGLDELSKKPVPTATTLTPKETNPKPAAEKATTPLPPKKGEKADEGAAPSEPSSAKEEPAKAETKSVVKSSAGKSLENRLSLGTSVGWSIVKPAKGTWIGVGSSDVSARWRASANDDSPLYITGRYAPLAGVWTTGNRDYDTTLHGIYGGAEYLIPTALLVTAHLKANVELGYMLVYARAQDNAPEASDVKRGTINLATGGGAEWGLLSNKVKMGPFVRLHFAGFTIINVGGSAQFVF